MSSVDNIEGGYDTARLTASEQDRAARRVREAAALRYLDARGLTDIAEMLGLTASPATEQPRRRVRRRGI